MNDILIYLASLPSLVVHGIVGALVGGLGGAIGGLLQSKFGLQWARYLPVVGLAAAIPLVNGFVEPRMIEAVANQNLPTSVDESTTLVRIDYRGKRFVYHYEVSANVPSETTAEMIKAAQFDALCAHWRPEFEKREVIGAEYRYLMHGKQQSFEVTPGDC